MRNVLTVLIQLREKRFLPLQHPPPSPLSQNPKKPQFYKKYGCAAISVLVYTFVIISFIINFYSFLLIAACFFIFASILLV